jgi:hypothetical protein
LTFFRLEPINAMPSLQALCLAALVALLASRLAFAQITLPQVQVPQLPVQTPIDVNRVVDQTVGAVNSRQLRELRRLRIRELLRTNRATLEADPRGAPIVRSEVVALSPTAAALDRAQAAGFEIVRRRALEGLDVNMAVLHAPAGMSTRRALRELQRGDPEGIYDFNHLYIESGETQTQLPAPPHHPESAPIRSDTRVGLIDGGVDRSHPVFQNVAIHEHGCDTPMPTAHGTAVGSLLVGSAVDFQGAAPGAQLYVADVYCGAAAGGAVDAVADGIAWLSRERVPVVSISLVGPANQLLEQVIHMVLTRGHIVVAAVGNDGPGAPPLFPAAYPGVLGVTGVDARNRVLLEACRGAQVAFAAPGADMSAAAMTHTYALVRGTSFAAPIVAGLLAQQVLAPEKAQADAAIAALASHAVDLGAKGPDKIYGKGLVGEELRNRMADHE